MALWRGNGGLSLRCLGQLTVPGVGEKHRSLPGLEISPLEIRIPLGLGDSLLKCKSLLKGR